MQPEINLLKSLIKDIKSGLELYKGVNTDLENIIKLSSKNVDPLTIKELVINRYVNTVREIKNPEKRLQYCQKILDTDIHEDAKLVVYFQIGEYFYNKNDKKNTLLHLNQAFDLLKNKKDKIIKKDDIIDMGYMFVYFDEVEKGLDCIVYAEGLEKEKKKKYNFFKTLGEFLRKD